MECVACFAVLWIVANVPDVVLPANDSKTFHAKDDRDG